MDYKYQSTSVTTLALARLEPDNVMLELVAFTITVNWYLDPIAPVDFSWYKIVPPVTEEILAALMLKI